MDYDREIKKLCKRHKVKLLTREDMIKLNLTGYEMAGNDILKGSAAYTKARGIYLDPKTRGKQRYISALHEIGHCETFQPQDAVHWLINKNYTIDAEDRPRTRMPVLRQ
jgi:hypothetical protein